MMSRTKKVNVTYDFVSSLYTELHGIPDRAVEVMSDFDIISAIASGLSVEDIVYIFNIEKKEVIDVCEKYFNFKGFNDRLDYNPYKIFKTVLKYKLETDTEELTAELFKNEVKAISKCSDSVIDESFKVASKMLELTDFIIGAWK